MQCLRLFNGVLLRDLHFSSLDYYTVLHWQYLRIIVVYYIALHRTILCTALYCTVLYCTVLYCTVQFYSAVSIKHCRTMCRADIFIQLFLTFILHSLFYILIPNASLRTYVQQVVWTETGSAFKAKVEFIHSSDTGVRCTFYE